MVSLQTPLCDFDQPAPDFDLPGVDGRRWNRDQCKGDKGLLVMFICNHCPFVKHIRENLVLFAQTYQQRRLAIIAINANDAAHYPHDSPAKMAEDAQAFNYPFPYLYDETQAVAQAYHAACTPDFFLFDADRRLAYRGQFDGSRPGNTVPVTGGDLRAAADAVLAGQPVAPDQKPSIGCNIKWKAGNEPVDEH